MNKILEELAKDYPVLYLSPDKDDHQAYRKAILSGVVPLGVNLNHYSDGENDIIELVDTPAGSVRVVTLADRQDFELVIRGLGAIKDGPSRKVPASQGAAMFSTYNWGKIDSHLSKFPESERAAEFKRFIGDKKNYVDRIILLSKGPYSGILAQTVGEKEESWLELSQVIRKSHEITHFICRTLYPEDIDPIRDEVIADAIGIYAAYGRYDEKMAKTFLGIDGDRYVGGRLENYSKNPQQEVENVCDLIDNCRDVIQKHQGTAAFEMIQFLSGY